MYNKEKDQQALKKMTHLSREIILRLSMSGALSYSIWVDFYSVLHKHKNIFKFTVRTTAKDINKWFEKHNKEWAGDMSNGFYYAMSDYYYEDLKKQIEELRKNFEDNYKKATMNYYELLGWTQLIGYFIQYSDLFFSKSMDSVKEAYGIDVRTGYNKYDFSACRKMMDNLYDQIWSKVKSFHTEPNVTINNNTSTCQKISGELIATMDDRDWIKECLRKAKLVYETNMYGYGELK